MILIPSNLSKQMVYTDLGLPFLNIILQDWAFVDQQRMYKLLSAAVVFRRQQRFHRLQVPAIWFALETVDATLITWYL